MPICRASCNSVSFLFSKYETNGLVIARTMTKLNSKPVRMTGSTMRKDILLNFPITFRMVLISCGCSIKLRCGRSHMGRIDYLFFPGLPLYKDRIVPYLFTRFIDFEPSDNGNRIE